MTDRVFPASKPAPNGTAAAVNGTTARTANGNGHGPIAPPPAAKSNLYNPASRPPYRPQPHNRRRRRSGRHLCCCCCIWTTIVILILILAAAIVGAALYTLYRPHRPTFSIPFARIHRLNLTTAADSSSAHLSTLFNLTLIAKNPNSHLKFSYEPFAVSFLMSKDDLLLGNGTLPAFDLGTKNETSFKNVVVSRSDDIIDMDSLKSLRSDLQKKDPAPVKVKMVLDTKVKVTIAKLRMKKVGIRVTCDGIKASVPKGKAPTVAVTNGVKCKVDLRLKIWKLTLNIF